MDTDISGTYNNILSTALSGKHKGAITIQNVHYNAFISYRHSALDSEIAAGIHRKLEAFSLPNNLKKDFPKERHKIRRVFRDTEELPLAENLSDPIDEALRNSDWLIVICSPRLKESRWCAREIELFSEYHGKDHILAVLAEGEPADSFPEAIRFREKKVSDPDGTERIVSEEVEPLAADVRGETKSERNRKMNDAVLRMAAPMYGLGYDDLKQRHREQRIRKLALISALVAAVFLIYAVTSTILTLRINEQKNIIEDQHNTLQEQYHRQQLNYARSMSQVSETLYKQGQGKAAAYAVRQTMPDTPDDPGIPYVASCQYALSNALGLYEADELIPEGVTGIPDDDFWQDAGDYYFLEDYLGGVQIMAAAPYDPENVILITSDAHIYLYNEADMILNDYTATFLAETPANYVSAAAYRDDALYLLYSQAPEAVCYRWKSYEGYEKAGTGSYEELSGNRGTMAMPGEPVDSDDGKYKAVTGDDHSLRIYDGSDSGLEHCLKAIYDIRGQFYSMTRLGGTEYYLLNYSGKFSYLLNEDLDVIARVAWYYGYSEEKRAFILYHHLDESADYELYYVPLRSYEEIIKLADDRIAGYEPGEEMLERYGMLSGN